MKLSTSRGVDTFQVSTPLFSLRNAGSSSWGIRGMETAGSPGQTQTRPYRSCTLWQFRCAVGGIAAPGPDDGTSTHCPRSPNVQPWYAQAISPSLYVPIESGACRCGHSSGAAIRSPLWERQRTRFSPSRRVAWGLSVTSVDSATGYQTVCSGARSANRVIGSSPRLVSARLALTFLVRPTDHFCIL